MSADPFSTASSSFQTMTSAENFGRLLLITPTEYLAEFKTKFSKDDKGRNDAVRIDYVILDGPDGFETVEDTLVFGAMCSRFERMAKFNEKNETDPKTGRPKMVLGRLGKGEDKDGDLTPNLYFTRADKRAWILEPPSEDDVKLARKWLEDNPVAPPSNPFEV